MAKHDNLEMLSYLHGGWIDGKNVEEHVNNFERGSPLLCPLSFGDSVVADLYILLFSKQLPEAYSCSISHRKM